MKNKFVYITDCEWFESTSLKNPIEFLDHNLQDKYPKFYEKEYDLRMLVTEKPSAKEKAVPFYNDYREKYGSEDIRVLKDAASSANARNVFLNGFDQEHFEYIIPYIKDSAEVLYLFKCPKISDLSMLSELKNLKCLFVYWNNSLEVLWNVKDNTRLKVISFISIMKIKNIETLLGSNIEYITFDSSDNNDNKKNILFDKSVFDKMPNLKYLKVCYKEIDIDY